MSILFFISFCGFFVVIQHFFSKHTWKAPLIAFSMHIAVLYCAALMNCLSFAVYLLLVSGLVGAGFVGYRVWFKKGDYRCFTPALLFLVLSFCFYFTMKGAHFHLWDEFSHWGRAVRELLLTDSIPRAGQTTLSFLDYPPATSLFHYYCSTFLGHEEGIAYVSMSILMSAAFFPVFSFVFHTEAQRTQRYFSATNEHKFTQINNPEDHVDPVKKNISVNSVALCGIGTMILFMYLNVNSELHSKWFLAVNLTVLLVCGWFAWTKNSKVALFFIVLSLLMYSPYVLGHGFSRGFQSLYVDCLLGMWWGGSLVIAYSILSHSSSESRVQSRLPYAST